MSLDICAHRDLSPPCAGVIITTITPSLPAEDYQTTSQCHGPTLVPFNAPKVDCIYTSLSTDLYRISLITTPPGNGRNINVLGGKPDLPYRMTLANILRLKDVVRVGLGRRQTLPPTTPEKGSVTCLARCAAQDVTPSGKTYATKRHLTVLRESIGTRDQLSRRLLIGNFGTVHRPSGGAGTVVFVVLRVCCRGTIRLLHFRGEIYPRECILCGLEP